MKILVTGAAGFIGYHLSNKLVASSKNTVIGLDIINDYYDINLKFDRLKQLGISHKDLIQNKILESSKFNNFSFIKSDLADHDFILDFMKNEQFDYVINLAAQAGVRYSIDNPRAYIHSNIDGFLSILEGSRHNNVKHLIYASTSSVYGLNSSMPLEESKSTDHPIAVYAATKKANELLAHSYSHLFGLPSSGLRFFTVYGPWGRPDMALFLFTEAILKKKPMDLFNYGNMIRDFTFVDDIVESICKLIKNPPKGSDKWSNKLPESDKSSAPYRIFNIGNGSPVKLMDYIHEIENQINIKGIYNFKEIQPGDVPATHASTEKLNDYIKFKPKTSVKDGIKKFLDWYVSYYNVK